MRAFLGSSEDSSDNQVSRCVVSPLIARGHKGGEPPLITSTESQHFGTVSIASDLRAQCTAPCPFNPKGVLNGVQ